MRCRRGRDLLLIVVIAVIAAALGGCGAGRPGPPPASAGLQLDRRVPASVASLPLTDDDGRSTTLGALRGRVVVLADFMTLCQEICPLTSANYAAMDRAVAAAHLQGRVQFVELTIDPERDVPARLHAYRQLFDAPRNWSLLTGSPEVVSRIWSWFHVYYQRVAEGSPPATDWWTGTPLTYDVDHEDVVAFVDASGHERFVLDSPPDAKGRSLPASLRRFMDALGRRNLATPGGDAWTVPRALDVLSWLTGREISPS